MSEGDLEQGYYLDARLYSPGADGELALEVVQLTLGTPAGAPQVYLALDTEKSEETALAFVLRAQGFPSLVILAELLHEISHGILEDEYGPEDGEEPL